MPTYCTLADAYGPEWGNRSGSNPEDKKKIAEANKKREEKYTKAQTAPKGEVIDVKKGDFPACPNCQHCLNQNNQFQQNVVDTAIRPLPRWVPQTQNLQAWDPFTRYFAPQTEHFTQQSGQSGQSLHSNQNTQNLLQLVLYLLIILFAIQLVELIGGLC
jgi:hypothetical protein